MGHPFANAEERGRLRLPTDVVNGEPGQLLVVVIFALNEEPTVGSLVRRVPRQVPGIRQVQVVVVDDGSTDRTAALAQEAGATVVSHPRNLGVGAALATGLDTALRMGADLIVHLDGDGQFNPEDIPRLIRPLQEEGYGLVTCTRFARREYLPVMPPVARWGNRAVAWCVRWVLWGARFTDVLCGFRAYTRDTAIRLTLFSRFTYTQESIIDAAAKGVMITEVPLIVRGVREFGKSRVTASVWWYAFRVGTIMLRAMRDVRPLMFFGSIAVALIVIGLLLCGAQVAADTAGWPRPTTLPGAWALAGVTSIVAGVVFGATALLADQVGRMRRLQEELRFLARIDYYERAQVREQALGA